MSTNECVLYKCDGQLKPKPVYHIYSEIPPVELTVHRERSQNISFGNISYKVHNL